MLLYNTASRLVCVLMSACVCYCISVCFYQVHFAAMLDCITVVSVCSSYVVTAEYAQSVLGVL